MPIKRIQNNINLPVIGKIRLGITKLSAKGTEYPDETVEAVYGKEPKSLEIFFPSDDENKCIPNWFKWYAGGVKGKDGKRIGGKLQCYGDGEVAYHLAARDPVTKVVPQRECKERECPDWEKNGMPQCKPSMSVYCILPRVSILGIYQIDTTSWSAIDSFVAQFTMLKEQYGKVKGIPFTIYRQPEQKTFVDKTGKQQTKTHYIMRIKPNEQFDEQYGAEVRQKLVALNPVWNADGQELIESSMEDNWPAKQIESADAPGEPDAELTGRESIEAVAEDAELAPLFSQLCEAKKVANTNKTRLLTARKFEKTENPKEELIKYLMKQIESTQGQPKAAAPPKEAKKPKSSKKKVEASPEQPELTPPTAEPPQPVETNSDGLI